MGGHKCYIGVTYTHMVFLGSAAIAASAHGVNFPVFGCAQRSSKSTQMAVVGVGHGTRAMSIFIKLKPGPRHNNHRFLSN